MGNSACMREETDFLFFFFKGRERFSFKDCFEKLFPFFLTGLSVKAFGVQKSAGMQQCGLKMYHKPVLMK